VNIYLPQPPSNREDMNNSLEPPEFAGGCRDFTLQMERVVEKCRTATQDPNLFQTVEIILVAMENRCVFVADAFEH
jgi:hypothetical protein